MLDTKQKNDIKFMIGIVLFMILSVVVYFEKRLDIMNTTVYAFSYRHGLVARGVLGTFLEIWDKYSPVDLMSYHTIYQISEAATLVYFVMLLWMTGTILKHCRDHEIEAKILLGCLMIFAVPMFLTSDNFGRLDVYLMIIMLFCMILILEEKFEVLILPSVALAALIHEGFVFMNLNIILVLLFYKLLTKQEKKEKVKYIALLVLTFTIPSIFFLYFEFFSHRFGTDVYQETIALAKKLSVDGKTYHKQVVMHEIMGMDIAGMEKKHHRWNREDTPIFLVLFSPYIILAVKFFYSYVKKCHTKVDKWLALSFLIAPLTLLPEIILKVDYGRYMFAICFYYIVMTLCYISMQEKNMLETVNQWKNILLQHKIWSVAGVCYLFMFVPFRGYRICDLVTGIVSRLFGN